MHLIIRADASNEHEHLRGLNYVY